MAELMRHEIARARMPFFPAIHRSGLRPGYSMTLFVAVIPRVPLGILQVDHAAAQRDHRVPLTDSNLVQVLK